MKSVRSQVFYGILLALSIAYGINELHLISRVWDIIAQTFVGAIFLVFLRKSWAFPEISLDFFSAYNDKKIDTLIRHQIEVAAPY